MLVSLDRVIHSKGDERIQYLYICVIRYVILYGASVVFDVVPVDMAAKDSVGFG